MPSAFFYKKSCVIYCGNSHFCLVILLYFCFLYNRDYFVLGEFTFQKELLLRQQRECFCTPAVIYSLWSFGLPLCFPLDIFPLPRNGVSLCHSQWASFCAARRQRTATRLLPPGVQVSSVSPGSDNASVSPGHSRSCRSTM